MKAKLIKLENGKYDLLVDTNLKNLEDTKLCLDNCQAIERNFDLVDHAIAYAGEGGRYSDPHGFSDKQIGLLQGYIDGFEKALELIGDKKFSEEDIHEAYFLGERENRSGFHDLLHLKQQTEWDVEIEMRSKDTDELRESNEGFLNNPNLYVPQLDEDGCLILKGI